MSAVSQQQEVPVGPDEALAVVNAQQQTYLKRHEIKSAPLLTAWGLAWLIGYVALALYREPDYGLPRAPYLFFCGCLTVALLFTVAYIVPKEHDLKSSQVRQELSENLTDFMIPEFIVKMPQIPLNTNGKPDMERMPVVMKVG